MAPAERRRTERLQICLEPDELRKIDDFWFKARMPNRAAAVRELLRRGLASAARLDPN
jgi:metal-responsive CopG/Arc/MetJ family transcriptional regulator